MRSWNITLSTLASFCVLACAGEDGEVLEVRAAEAALTDLEDAHADTRACVQTMTECLQAAADDASAQTCVDQARVCMPGEGEEEDDDDEADSEGMPALPEEAEEGRPEFPEDSEGMPALPEEAGSAGEEQEEEEDAAGGGRPELPAATQARNDAAACVEAAGGCLESAEGEDAATCVDAVRDCVAKGPIADMCTAAEDICAGEDVPAEACERVTERC